MKSFLKASRIVICVLGALLIVHMLGRAVESNDKDDHWISHPGKYRINDGQWSLVVEKIRSGIVSYKLVDASGKVIFDHGRSGFNSWNWIMYWEKASHRLWLLSGDIGTHVCMRDNTGRYQSIAVIKENATLIKDVPQEVYEQDEKHLNGVFEK